MERIIPVPTPLCQPYFDGCREGVLRLQYCGQCQRHQFYPRLFCSHCAADTLSWRAASGRGTIASFSVVRRAVSKAYEAPYVVALIDLDEKVRMMSNVIDVDPDQVHSGMAVTVDFEPWSDTITLPVFRPARIGGDA